MDAFTFVPSCPTGDCGVLAVDPPAPRAAAELATRPNPFRSSTTFRFTTARDGTADVEVLDVLGRRVRALHAGFLAAGKHESAWDGRDEDGRPAPAGVYLCRLRTADGALTRRVVLVR